MLPVGALINVLVILIFMGFWVSAFAILYHLTRFGVGVVPKRFAALFLIGSVILFCASVILYQSVDFSLIFR